MSTENEPVRQVSARLDAVGHGTVTVDGQDLTNILRGIEVRAMAGEATQVALHVTPGRAVEYDGPAFVTVVQPSEPGGDLAAFADWLGKVDPARLEQAALSRPDLTNDRHGLTQAVLSTLAAWARGEE
jgi:hypothetical protein